MPIFIGYTGNMQKCPRQLNLDFKAEKQLQNEKHAEDWALGSHPRDNGHVTH